MITVETLTNHENTSTAARVAKALQEQKSKQLEPIEDQLCDIQMTLETLVENSTYGSDNYWKTQTVELTKLYLQNMITSRQHLQKPMPKAYLARYVEIALGLAKETIAALKAGDL